MAKEQYAVKIEQELFDELEKIKFENGLRSRDELFELLTSTYKKQSQLDVSEQLDLSQYDEIEEDAKKSIKDGFELIITTMKQYNKKNKFHASQIEKDKISLDEKREELENQLKDIKLKHNDEIKKIEEDHKITIKLKDEDILSLRNDINSEKVEKEILKSRLESLNKEMENLRSIAENTKVVIEENKQVNRDIRDMKDNQEQKKKELEEDKQNLKNLHNEELKKQRDELKELQEKYLNVLSEKTEIISTNKYHEKELESLKNEIKSLKEDQYKQIQILETNHTKEMIQLKEYEKENIILQTKLELLKK